MNEDQQIEKFIAGLRLWIFWKRLIHRLLWCVPAGIFTGAVMEGISYFIPWYSVHYWAAAAVAAGIAAAFIWSLWQYPSAGEAAAILDRTGLKERTVTALELTGDSSFFAELQKRDALEKLKGIVFRKSLPIRITWKRPALLCAACVLLAISCILPSPAKREAKSLHEITKKAEKEAEKVEKVRGELAGEELEKTMSEEYDRLLDAIMKELKAAASNEELKKSLERAEHKLTQMAEKTENKKQKNQLKQLAMALNPNKNGESGEKNGNESEKNGLQAAAELQKAAEAAEKQLEELLKELETNGDLKELSEEELKAAKEALEKLANLSESQGISKELSEELQKLASQLALGSAKSSALASGLASVSTVKMAAASKLAQAGSNGKPAASGTSGEGNGAGNGSESSLGSGSEGASGSGSGSGSGGGSGGGSGNGSGGGSGAGTGWNYGSNKGTEKEISYEGELVSVPNGVGDDDNLTGTQNEGSSFVTEGGDSLTWAGNKVKYSQVIGDYSKQAMSEIEKSNYPAGIQDIVKSYFEQLNQ